MNQSKYMALKALGLPEATIDELLADVMATEKAAEAEGVRYKDSFKSRPSQEAAALDAVCEANGWSPDGADSAPLYDVWVSGGLQQALSLAVRCKAAGMTPLVYTTDPIARAFAAPPSSDWRPR